MYVTIQVSNAEDLTQFDWFTVGLDDVMILREQTISSAKIPYVGKFWSGKKLANRGLFANILLANYFFLEYSS